MTPESAVSQGKRDFGPLFPALLGSCAVFLKTAFYMPKLYTWAPRRAVVRGYLSEGDLSEEDLNCALKFPHACVLVFRL